LLNFGAPRLPTTDGVWAGQIETNAWTGENFWLEMDWDWAQTGHVPGSNAFIKPQRILLNRGYELEEEEQEEED
jgi:hypothetical protein